VASRRYENFDLLIEEEQDGYQARVTACPSNETPSTRFVLPFDETKLENLLLKLDPGRTDMRRGPGDAREVASRELGGALYSAVFTEDIRDAWTRSLDQVQARDCGLRLRLKLTDAPLLAGLPWELLYSVRTNRYPAQSESTPVIRFLGDRGASKALRVEGPLTILFVICSPTDLPDLDTENEWRAVQQELKPLVDRGVVRLERLPDPATPARLLDRLSDGPVHIVHFVGHGDYDEATQDGVVYFCTEYSTKNKIGADRLGSVLQDVEDLKLVVLNACHSARGDSHDVFGGMAQGLVRFSVSAVAAMQFPISDKAASTFSRSLYRAIARGNPVDQAIASARKAILMAYPSEWATPVLYLRTNDGVIFDLPAVKEPDVGVHDRPTGKTFAPAPGPRKLWWVVAAYRWSPSQRSTSSGSGDPSRRSSTRSAPSEVQRYRPHTSTLCPRWTVGTRTGQGSRPSIPRPSSSARRRPPRPRGRSVGTTTRCTSSSTWSAPSTARTNPTRSTS